MFFPKKLKINFSFLKRWNRFWSEGSLLDEKMKVEAIEALIYPGEDGKGTSEERFQEIIDEVNHELKPYQKINRFKVLDKPMEMTTTKKIKRFAVDK